MNTITATIKGAMSRNGVTALRLAKLTGINYNTIQYRWKNPGSWKLVEWSALQRHLDFLPDEMELIRREVKKL